MRSLVNQLQQAVYELGAITPPVSPRSTYAAGELAAYRDGWNAAVVRALQVMELEIANRRARVVEQRRATRRRNAATNPARWPRLVGKP
jgi:hypothetical protein